MAAQLIPRIWVGKAHFMLRSSNFNLFFMLSLRLFWQWHRQPAFSQDFSYPKNIIRCFLGKQYKFY